MATRNLCYKSLALAVAIACSTAATSQEVWPSKPITAVAVFAPGGAGDGVTRMVSQKLSSILGQQVIVDNRIGGGGTIGAAYVARAQPDGYTLLMMSSSHVIGESLYPNRKYDLAKDFAPISLIGTSPYWLVINPKETKATTVAELVASAKDKEGGLTFASGGVGSLSHLQGEMMKSQGKLRMVHIPYKGNAASLTDIMAGRVDLMFDQPLSSEQFVKAGKIKPLAVTSLNRLASWPEIPTMAESGFPKFEAVSWFSFAAPAGTPPNVINRLNAAMVQALASPDLRKQLETAGVTPGSSTPAEARALMLREIPMWRSVIDDGHIKVE